jgi:hypothetical protein
VDLRADDQIGIDQAKQSAQQMRPPLLGVGPELADLTDETECTAYVSKAQHAAQSVTQVPCDARGLQYD